MQSKLYLLLAVLCVSALCSLSAEQTSEKSDPASDSRKTIDAPAIPNNRRQQLIEAVNEIEDEHDDHSPLTSYAPNRYSPQNSPRGRSRWSSPSSSSSQRQSQPSSSLSLTALEDYMNGGNEWSQTGFGSLFSGSPSHNPQDNYQPPNDGPVCYSLVDSQFPIFADICGAVPQARYTLPNPLGHRERWQVAQVLSSIISSSEDSSCLRSLRLLLCPVLFPPCKGRHEYTTIVPCQSYCRAVKSRCHLPALDLLRCETLPHSSDLCPVSQPAAPYKPSGPQSPAKNGGYQPSNYPPSRSQPSLQSLLSSPPGFQSPSFQGPAQSSPSMSYYNNGPMGADASAASHGDYPSRSFQKNYRQGSRYTPSARLSPDGRPTLDGRSLYPRV